MKHAFSHPTRQTLLDRYSTMAELGSRRCAIGDTSTFHLCTFERSGRTVCVRRVQAIEAALCLRSLWVITGSAIGAGLAIYFAPRLASELRQRVTNPATGLRTAASDGVQAVANRVADVADDGTRRGQAARDDVADVVANVTSRTTWAWCYSPVPACFFVPL